MKRKFTTKTQLKQKPGIYKISCTESEKVYVGESVNISRRIQKHFSLLRNQKHSNPILQNMFNKHKEETFVVEVLEYTENSDELFLKTLEKEYQDKEKYCISLDSNQIFCVERSEEWKAKQGELLSKYREQTLDEYVRKPVIVYNIIDKSHTRFKQITDCYNIVEQKHVHKNINEKILIPYKHTYVVFLEEDFTQENISKIISVKNTENIKYGAVRTMCELHNLYTDEIKYFASKVQFSYEFSDSKNDKLYDRYLNEHFIDFNFRCVNPPKTKSELFKLNILIRNARQSKKVNFKLWYETLTKCTTKVSMSEMCGIDRKIIALALKDRSQIEWLRMMDVVVSKLPD